MCLHWDLSDSFLMIRLGLWVFRRKITEIKYRFNHILFRVHHYDLPPLWILIAWLMQSLLGFSPIKLFSPLPFHTVLWKEVTMSNSHFRSQSYVLPPWGQSVYINDLKSLCMEDLSILSRFLIHSFIYIRTFFSSNHLAMTTVLCIFLAAVLFLYLCSLDPCLPFKLLCSQKSICYLKTFFSFLLFLSAFILKTFLTILCLLEKRSKFSSLSFYFILFYFI